MKFVMKSELPSKMWKDLGSILTNAVKTRSRLMSEGEQLLLTVDNVRRLKNDEYERFIWLMADYVRRCKSEMKLIRESRKLYTNKLLEVRDHFTGIENSMDPDHPDTLPNRIREELDYLLTFQNERKRSAELADHTDCRYKLEVLQPEGYMDLLLFWWEQKGQLLPANELNRIFSRQINYARRRALDGDFIGSSYLHYTETVRLS